MITTPTRLTVKNLSKLPDLNKALVVFDIFPRLSKFYLFTFYFFLAELVNLNYLSFKLSIRFFVLYFTLQGDSSMRNISPEYEEQFIYFIRILGVFYQSMKNIYPRTQPWYFASYPTLPPTNHRPGFSNNRITSFLCFFVLHTCMLPIILTFYNKHF